MPRMLMACRLRRRLCSILPGPQAGIRICAGYAKPANNLSPSWSAGWKRSLIQNFQDVTVQTGLDKVFMPMGANFGDIDNDGYLDIYLGTGNPSYISVIPNVLLHNKE